MMNLALQLKSVEKDGPSQDDYLHARTLFLQDVSLRRVLEDELLRMLSMRNGISAKQLKDEEFRITFAYLDGQIDVYSGLLSGEFVPPALLPSPASPSPTEE